MLGNLFVLSSSMKLGPEFETYAMTLPPTQSTLQLSANSTLWFGWNIGHQLFLTRYDPHFSKEKQMETQFLGIYIPQLLSFLFERIL